MNGHDRRSRHREAERALKRGDLSEAHARFSALLAEAPGDEALRSRVQALASMVPPHERQTPPEVPTAAAGSDPTAEAAAARGDEATALATYQRRLAGDPDNRLLKDRVHALRIALLERLLAQIARRKRLAQDAGAR